MTTARLSNVQDVLGGRRVLGPRIIAPRELAQLVRKGFPYAALRALAACLGVRDADLVALLGISPRTLARRRAADRLDPISSDRLLRVARVLARTIEVLGSEDRASRWMTRPNRALGGVTPLSDLDTEIGEQEVLSLLGRLEHGIPS